MVPPASHQVSRVWCYSGYPHHAALTHTGLSPAMAGRSRPFRFDSHGYKGPTTPGSLRTPVCPNPRSLAATDGVALLSFPAGTEMFHFPAFALDTYVFSAE